MGRAKLVATAIRRSGTAALIMLLLLAAQAGCGRASDGEIVTGQLRAGDLDYWLVGTTLVAIGGAQISGEPSQIGSTVRAEGRRQPDGVFAATRISVGAADPSATAASLPTATASGAVEALDPATGRWQVGGRQVQLAPGLALPGGIAVGDRVTVKGFALPDGSLLAAEVADDHPLLTTTPTRSAPIPTATPPAPAAPGHSTIPASQPTEKPTKTKRPRDNPGNGGGDDND